MRNFFEMIKMPPPPNVSDFHLSPGRPPTFRTMGQLVPIPEADPVSPEETYELVKELLNPAQMDMLYTQGEVDLSVMAFGQPRCRVNVFRQRGSYALSFRVTTARIPSFEELGLPPSVLKLCSLTRGLVIVAGPTGTGKTTTLAAMLDWMNKNRKCHIVTLEDPIEYSFTHDKAMINQREVGTDTMSFGAGLRSALRQDPDVIMVGEMRDLETISTVLTAAETGHLVLSTLHTIGAAKTIDRIVDVFPEHQQQQIRVQLSMVLQGIVSQQLIGSASDDGKRVLATELLLPSSAVRNLIRKGSIPQIANTIAISKDKDMHTMDASLIDLFVEGSITLADAMAYSVEPENMIRVLKEKGFKV